MQLYRTTLAWHIESTMKSFSFVKRNYLPNVLYNWRDLWREFTKKTKFICFLVTNRPCGHTLCPFNTRCIAVDGAARCEPVLDLDPICANVECNLDQKCALLDGKATCEQACLYDRDCQLKLVGSSCDTLLGICK
jgi:hypothetical protein